MMKSNKKAGVVGDLISGTGGLIIVTIIVFVIVSTLLAANIITDSTPTSTITNEAGAYLNATTYTVDSSGADQFNSLVITGANNFTGATPLVILTDNFSVSGTGFTNATVISANYSNVTINYTFVSTDINYSLAGTSMSGNFSSGIDNISGKIPTILLIGAVVLLFGVIVLLVRQSGAMGIGGGRASL